jgi:hypothetical protein
MHVHSQQTRWCSRLTSPSQRDIPGDRLPRCQHLHITTIATTSVQHKQPSQARNKCLVPAGPFPTMNGVAWIKLMYPTRLARSHTYTLLKHLMPLSQSVCTSPDVQAHASSANGLNARVDAEQSVHRKRRPWLHRRHCTAYMEMSHL